MKTEGLTLCSHVPGRFTHTHTHTHLHLPRACFVRRFEHRSSENSDESKRRAESEAQFSSLCRLGPQGGLRLSQYESMEAKKVRNKGLATKVSSTFAASLNHASNWSTVLQLPHPHVETVCQEAFATHWRFSGIPHCLQFVTWPSEPAVSASSSPSQSLSREGRVSS